MWWPKKVWQKHGAEILNCNRQSYGAAKLIWAHNFKFNWWVLKPSLSHFSSLKSLHYFFYIFFGGSSYHEIIVSQEPKMVWGSKLYVHVTEHYWEKRAIGFPVRHNASRNKSLQNAFPIYECKMERRYKIQCTPFYYKNWCTGPFFLLELSTNQRTVPSTCSPF